MPDTAAPAIRLHDQPGHLIRRAQQIAVSVFYDTLGRDVTPVQYAILKCLADKPGIDQVTLAQEVALDTSSTASIAVRLETKGWIVRHQVGRGQRSLELTEEGRETLSRLDDKMPEMQHTLLQGFSEEDRETFMRLLQQFADMNNDKSRAPLRPGGGGSAEG
ncbi:MarR family transcriptional regulator [Rhodoferax koreense]|uniref:MarR family transcriptional regulator n=1 Tax=Rhodoferax koreensis TaxID=1842727 RepID=A0A1P8JVK4_9BURK|nr:MarR family transcriptional regulator [Rhodoferax koreense]APW37790.1 MarR family transcriptional regulator [Rhodoferax koreense]